MGEHATRTRQRHTGVPTSAPDAVGERVRAARLERGLTQAELGGSRFSKEYVSQVELGKTRPSAAALAWFAERLAVDHVALEGDGGPAAAAAQRSCDRARRGRDRGAPRTPRRSPSFRQLGERFVPAMPGWASATCWRRAGPSRTRAGWTRRPVILAGARARAEELGLARGGGHRALPPGRRPLQDGQPGDRGRACWTRRSPPAPDLPDPSDALRARIFNARAKIRRRQKDFTAAAEDISQALELARGAQ